MANRAGQSWKKNVTRGLIVVFLLLGVVAGVCSYFSAKQAKLRQETEDAFRNANYDVLIELIEKIPEPYKRYNEVFIRYSREFSNWEGTGPEFFQWVDTFFSDSDLNAALLDDDNSWLFWRKNYETEKESFFNHRNEIADQFIWYPVAYQLQVSFYQEYVNLLIQNRNLFALPAIDGIVSIPCSEIDRLDAEMEYLYYSTVESLDLLAEQYGLNFLREDFFSDEKEQMADYHEFYYSDIAVSRIYDYDIQENAYIHINAEDAQHNYGVLDSRIDYGLYDRSFRYNLSASLENAINQAQTEFEAYRMGFDFFGELSEPVSGIITNLLILFPNAVPRVTDPYYASRGSLGDVINQTYEELK